jgi:protein-S-isoprenylcysteine O-methyltransferase Ste14
MKMLKKPWKPNKKVNSLLLPNLLVIGQFLFIFLLLFTANIFAVSFVLFSIQILGIILGLWSIYIMQIGNFNITPIPVENGELRKNGPYSLIRHPMYTSIFLFCIPQLIGYFSYLRLVYLVCLILVLWFKMNYEETKLRTAYSDYDAYSKKTKRFIPYLY